MLFAKHREGGGGGGGGGEREGEGETGVLTHANSKVMRGCLGDLNTDKGTIGM